MVQIAIPYAYSHTVRVYAYGSYVPYAYNIKYSCGTQQAYYAQKLPTYVLFLPELPKIFNT